MAPTKQKKLPKKQKLGSPVILIPRKYVEAVEIGTLWLDLTFGPKEWLKKMNMTNFDIKDPGLCVAGNVFRDAMGDDGYEKFETAMSELGLEATEMGNKFGFFAGKTYDASDKGWQFLQDLWVRQINKLKKQRHVK